MLNNVNLDHSNKHCKEESRTETFHTDSSFDSLLYE